MYKRRYSRPVRNKRQTERIIRSNSGSVPSGNTTVAYIYEAESPVTITNWELDILNRSTPSTTPTTANLIPYALVIVKQGYNANNITFPALSDDMYNPTKAVVISGVQSGTSEDHKRSRYSRKLEIGDRVALLFYGGTSESQVVGYKLSASTVY